MNDEGIDEFEPERFWFDKDSDDWHLQDQLQDEERVRDGQPDQELVKVLVGLDQAQGHDGQEVAGQAECSEDRNPDAFDPKVSANRKKNFSFFVCSSHSFF